MPPNATRPAAMMRGEPCGNEDQAGEPISPTDNPSPDLPQPFVDRFGHRHSAAILKNWSAAALRVMQVRRVGNESFATPVAKAKTATP